MAHEIPERHALFIAHLARFLNESELADVLSRASSEQNHRAYHGGGLPALSSSQQAICEWLLKDEFAKSADAALVAERDAANTRAETERNESYSKRYAFETMCRKAGEVRGAKRRLESAMNELVEHLKEVPDSKDRY